MNATATYVAAAFGVPSENITWVQADPGDRETMLENGDVELIFSTYSITDQRKQVVISPDHTSRRTRICWCGATKPISPVRRRWTAGCFAR